VWLQPGSLTLEYGGETLSTYDVEISRETGKLTAVGDARLFGTAYVLPQLRLFALDDSEWPKAMKLGGVRAAPPIQTHAFAGGPVSLPRRPVTVAS
jgi:hypothetical protein